MSSTYENAYSRLKKIEKQFNKHIFEDIIALNVNEKNFKQKVGYLLNTKFKTNESARKTLQKSKIAIKQFGLKSEQQFVQKIGKTIQKEKIIRKTIQKEKIIRTIKGTSNQVLKQLRKLKKIKSFPLFLQTNDFTIKISQKKIKQKLKQFGIEIDGLNNELISDSKLYDILHSYFKLILEKLTFKRETNIAIQNTYVFDTPRIAGKGYRTPLIFLDVEASVEDYIEEDLFDNFNDVLFYDEDFYGFNATISEYYLFA